MEPQESVNLLGFRIDRTLIFGKHIDTICKILGKQLSVSQKLLKDVSHDEKTLISESLIISNMPHCPKIWHF